MQTPRVQWMSTAVLVMSLCTLADGSDPMLALAAQEQRFAEYCKNAGIRDSFLAFFDDDVVTFGPELRVGTGYLKARPANSAASPRLEWHISAAGDLGYTTGPSTLTLRPDDPAFTRVLHLVFFSVWRKRPGSDWKVVFDAGLTVPSSMNDRPFRRAAAPAANYRGPVNLGNHELLEAERTFGDLSQSKGLLSAFGAFAEPQIQVNRDNHFPVQGLVQAKALLKESQKLPSYKVRLAVVAASGDMTVRRFLWSSESILFGVQSRLGLLVEV